jgi:hypothetical protein
MAWRCEWLGGAVVLGDELHDLAGLALLGGEDASLEQTAAENRKPDLDLVQPAGVSRCEVETGDAF